MQIFVKTLTNLNFDSIENVKAFKTKKEFPQIFQNN